MYQPTHWRKEEALMMMRRLIPGDPVERLTFFLISKESYRVFVMSMKLLSLNSWRFYDSRTAEEFIIKERKGGYSLGKMPT
jgi:hypothetical protein